MSYADSLFMCDAYVVGYSEKYYGAIKDDPKLHVKLTGSWETIVGEQDTFCEFLKLYI